MFVQTSKGHCLHIGLVEGRGLKGWVVRGKSTLQRGPVWGMDLKGKAEGRRGKEGLVLRPL